MELLWKNRTKKVVISMRFERMTLCLGGRCSIQLSYETTLIFQRNHTSKLLQMPLNFPTPTLQHFINFS